MRWLLLLAPGLAWAQDHVVAVLPFDTHTERSDLRPLGGGIADMLATDLQRGKDVRIVERARLDALVSEWNLASSDFIDAATAVRLGSGLGASEVVVGGITVVGETLRIDARVVEVGTTEAIVVAHQEGDVAAFFDLERALAMQLLDELGARVPTHQLRALDKPIEDVAVGPVFWQRIDARIDPVPVSTRVEMNPVLTTPGIVAAGVGTLLVGGTYGLYRTDPSVDEGGWKAMQTVNTVGWVSAVGGLALVASGTRIVTVDGYGNVLSVRGVF